MEEPFFSVGLVQFCRAQPIPWLALAVAVPYLVIVLGMGYTRQGIALGLAMLGLTSLRKNLTWHFLAWVLLGATFHKTAVLLLPIAALASTKDRIWTAVWVVIVTIGAYFLFLAESVDSLYANYLEREYQSEGALVPIADELIASSVTTRLAPSLSVAKIGRILVALVFNYLSGVVCCVLLLTVFDCRRPRCTVYASSTDRSVFSSPCRAWEKERRGKMSGLH